MANDFDAVRAKLSQVLLTKFAAVRPGTVIQFENQPVTRPTNDVWCYFTISPNKSYRKNIGLHPRRFIHCGVVVLNVMAPENQGTKDLNNLVEAAFYALADQNFDLGENGYLRTCYAVRRNRGTINGYNTGNVQVEYHHEVDVALGN